ncbi:copper transporter [Selenihalanaerobacter shriftii]|uniref:Copper transport outer membrane protein, MctB n=1 Tax=Selenihalanaerobacter shriftii TaxID=142842 RepID=A0A1T4P2S8_9FIRM|nr:copper transporter [Selenihalanaerobacter shriftii]SJZ85258.1 Copper transport outer membrane protein, MctB [Selenihalanaerobacter shriftii]
MVIDLRYQIITVVIIFLSLGIGILIGSSMVGEEGVIKEQKRLISRLETDFNQLRQNNQQFQNQVQSLQEKLETNHKFQEKILPLVIKDKINGSKVLVVYNNDDFKEKAAKMKQILRIAGSDKITIKTVNNLKENSKIETYDYLICLGKEEFFVDRGIKNKFQGIVKRISYLSESFFMSNRKLIKYILELNKGLDDNVK